MIQRLHAPPMPRRVAVLRALQLGDMLCAVPALRALRCALPGAAITLIGLPWARDFVDRFSHYIDDFIEFPGWPGLPERDPDASAIPRFLERVRAGALDVVVQMHGDGRTTNAITSLLGAHIIAGACADDAWRPDGGLFAPYPDSSPERMRALAALQPLGIAASSHELEFPVFEDDRLALMDAMQDATDGVDTVVVHPGARSATRRWPAVYFAAVADGLAELGYRVVVTGTACEAALAQEVAAAMHAPAAVLAGRTTVGSLAALIERCGLVVSNDTGVAHMAEALHTPSVVMFTGSDATRWASFDIRLHRPVRHPRTLDPAYALSEARDLLARERLHAV